jgi:hypothetical protein
MDQILVPLYQDGVGFPVAGETLRDDRVLVSLVGP